MKYKLNIFLICLLVFLSTSGTSVILADNTSQLKSNDITLDIVWENDAQTDRPQAIYIELYRTVDGKEVTVETRKITKEQAKANDANTWTTTFTNLEGQSWEYAFHVSDAESITDLYPYAFHETGEGTDHRIFTYTKGVGDTQMQLEIQWQDDSNQDGTRPDYYTVNLFSLSDPSGDPERSITLTKQNASKTDSNTWTAIVSGLEDDPSNYAVSPASQSTDYQNRVVRGSKENIYIMTNTYSPTSVGSNSTSQSTAQAVSQAATALSSTANVKNGILQFAWINLLILVLIAVLSSMCIMKHRQIQQKKYHTKKNSH